MKNVRYLLSMAALLAAFTAYAQVPRSFKWLGSKEVVFSFDGSYSDTAW